jgi:hypothetical protein
MTSFSFHAQIPAEAIEKVGRLFNASVDDPRFGPAIRIAGDGAGLDDPRSLFSLGRSGWSKALSLS